MFSFLVRCGSVDYTMLGCHRGVRLRDLELTIAEKLRMMEALW
jgi:hypothetical protein